MKSFRMKVLALLTLCLSACHVYRGEQIEGWVVDEATQEPLEGAVVTAVWELYGGLIHGKVVGNLVTQEVVTDATGHFVLPAWGTKVVLWNALDNSAPRLIAFHRDYYFQITGHEDPRDGRPPPEFTDEKRGCSCSGKAIGLRRFDGDWTNYEDNADHAAWNMQLSAGSESFRCTWTKMPKLAAEVLRRGSELRRLNLYHSLPDAERLLSSGCGSADFLGWTNENNKNGLSSVSCDCVRDQRVRAANS